jgi:acetyl-CoA C-acetyltransferase
MNRKVVIAGGARIPFCRAGSNYADVTNQELMTASIRAVVEKFKLEGKSVGDVALGGVMNHASDWNMAREVVLGSGLAPETPAFGIQRACGTGVSWNSSIISQPAAATRISAMQHKASCVGSASSVQKLFEMVWRTAAQEVEGTLARGRDSCMNQKYARGDGSAKRLYRSGALPHGIG